MHLLIFTPQRGPTLKGSGLGHPKTPLKRITLPLGHLKNQYKRTSAKKKSIIIKQKYYELHSLYFFYLLLYICLLSVWEWAWAISASLPLALQGVARVCLSPVGCKAKSMVWWAARRTEINSALVWNFSLLRVKVTPWRTTIYLGTHLSGGSASTTNAFQCHTRATNISQPSATPNPSNTNAATAMGPPIGRINTLNTEDTRPQKYSPQLPSKKKRWGTWSISSVGHSSLSTESEGRDGNGENNTLHSQPRLATPLPNAQSDAPVTSVRRETAVKCPVSGCPESATT